jgi:hypothetical protein
MRFNLSEASYEPAANEKEHRSNLCEKMPERWHSRVGVRTRWPGEFECYIDIHNLDELLEWQEDIGDAIVLGSHGIVIYNDWLE